MQPSETVVVIDDDNEIRTVVELALAKAGRTVIGFGDGDEALRFLSGGDRVDLVVSDVVMEGYDGHRLLRHLRSEPKTASTPVVFVTDGDEAQMPIGGLFDRGVGHVRKPFDIAALRRVADDAMRRPAAALLRDRDTGLLTPEHFDRALESATRGAAEAGTPIAVVLGEIDRTAVPAARVDEIQRRIAAIVSSQLRGTDVAGRPTVDRFASLHGACDAAGATVIGQRILAAIAADAGCTGASVTIGIAAAADARDADPPRLLAAAETALAVAAGRRPPLAIEHA